MANKKIELEQAINTLESQRALLGDATVDAAIAALKAQQKEHNKELPTQNLSAQRKQVTILFADISGFTAMSEEMDVEDITDLMNSLWNVLDQAILQHGGYIDKHIGDAVMAIWGVNQAKESDPQQAIHAALEMQRQLDKLVTKKGISLKMRVGIHTGQAMLSRMGTTKEFTAMGDAVNTASRLEHAAPKGGILISQNTYNQVQALFELTPLDLLTVKGKQEPLKTYIVHQAQAPAFQPNSRGVAGIETEMVGRNEELTQLQRAWQLAKTESQTVIVTVIGDAGIGKSRLLYEFREWLTRQSGEIEVFRGRSIEQTRNIPHVLLRDMFSRHFSINGNDVLSDALAKFESGISLHLDKDAEMKAHLLGQWLGFDFSQSTHMGLVQGNNEQLKNRAVLYLKQYWTTVANQKPIILFCEDAHWADGISLSTILRFAQAEPALPLLVVMVARPDLFKEHPELETLNTPSHHQTHDPSLYHKPTYQSIYLNPLNNELSRNLLRKILKHVVHIPEQIVELVANRADGNPFYIEELVKMLLDQKVIVAQSPSWHIDLDRLDDAQIPLTLTGLLQARLDHLQSNEKKTIQQASVIGRVFWNTAVKNLAGQKIDLSIKNLQEKELVYKQRKSLFVDTNEFLFKHDLLRDVTYETVLKKERGLYHSKAAEWLVTTARKNDRLDEYTAVIGTHYQRAGATEEASIWYGRAGQQALSQHAHNEAIHYLSLAIDLMPRKDTEQRYQYLMAREEALNSQGERQAQKDDLQN